ncbi:hypothetical protein [Methanogenium sp. MK-MG]|uniref:hypothetical protein n=1 Tax=Methanogenium sp. MK-MG TaxID=2599926 RepID=UPI0013E9D50D|nr:hypothetical protein [Methanogenium sp. MK-MG]
MMKSPGPYRSNTSDSSAPLSENSGTVGPTGSFTIGNPVSPIQVDDDMKSEEQEGLSAIEKAAMELSMNKHRQAYNRLASD